MGKRIPKTPTLPESEWNFIDIPSQERAACLYYEYGREANHFKKRVLAWRERHRDYMDGARRFLACKGPLTFGLSKSFKNSNPPKGKKHAKALKVYYALDDWLRPRQLLSREVEQDLWYPEGLTPDDPLRFLYEFPSFPDYAWQRLSSSDIERLLVIFCRHTKFPPPIMAKRTNRQPVSEISPLIGLPALQSHLFRGTSSWEWNMFMEQPALQEGDSFGRFPDDSWAMDKEQTKLWVGGSNPEFYRLTQ